MSDNGLKRRDFLKTSGGTLAGAAAATSSAGVLLGSNTAAALELDTLGEHQGKTLLRMCRQLYPHDFLADQYYANVVRALDDDAGNNADTAAMLNQGVADLDAAMGINWVDLSDGNQLSVLQNMQDSAFFGAVKGKVLAVLYNDPLVWRHFGYEGEAFSQGGYINRGFDDLTWLPAPPEDASPKAG